MRAAPNLAESPRCAVAARNGYRVERQHSAEERYIYYVGNRPKSKNAFMLNTSCLLPVGHIMNFSFFSLRLSISVPLRYSIYFVPRHAANTDQLLY